MAWSLGNTSEALPGVLTPLGWTFWRDHLNVAIRRAYYALGALPRRELAPDPDPLKNFGAAFYGRYTASIELGRKMADLMPGTSAVTFDRAIFGSVQPGTPERGTRRRYPIVAWRLPLQFAVVRRRLTRTSQRVRGWWEEAAFEPLPWPSGLAKQRVTEAGRWFDLIMADHTIVTYLGQRAVASLRAVTGDSPGVDLDDLMVSGASSLTEREMLADVWALASGQLEMDDFLHRHGFYSPHGGAIDAASWREDPAPLDSYCKTIARAGEDPPNVVLDRRAARGNAAVRDFLRSLPLRRRMRARAAVAAAKAFVPFREVGKASFLQALDVLRAAAHARRAELADAGLIGSADDVFYLTEQELLADVPRSDLKDVIDFRRRRRDRYRELDLPRLWTGDPDPVPADRTAQQARDNAAPDDTERQGAGVSSGVVEGRVRVITSPEIEELEPDEILVCVSTDPGWAPLLYMAAGLITELGGMLSHGAIIARELSLPAAVNVANATSWLRTGDQVRLDGASGVVTRTGRA
jgi:pyruvate,water dikinase